MLTLALLEACAEAQETARRLEQATRLERARGFAGPAPLPGPAPAGPRTSVRDLLLGRPANLTSAAKEGSGDDGTVDDDATS